MYFIFSSWYLAKVKNVSPLRVLLVCISLTNKVKISLSTDKEQKKNNKLYNTGKRPHSRLSANKCHLRFGCGERFTKCVCPSVIWLIPLRCKSKDKNWLRPNKSTSYYTHSRHKLVLPWWWWCPPTCRIISLAWKQTHKLAAASGYSEPSKCRDFGKDARRVDASRVWQKNHAVCDRCKRRDCARPDRAALVALEMCHGSSRQSQVVCDFDIILTAENSSLVKIWCIYNLKITSSWCPRF